MKKMMILLAVMTLASVTVDAQPQARRKANAQAAQKKSNSNTMTERALLSFPTQQKMSEDVVWRRDVYRELDLTKDDNAALYYPVEPVGSQMNLFTYMFKLMLSGQVPAYEYRIDGNESFEADARVKPLAFLDNYHIFYERKDGKLKLDNSDIPSREVKSYYVKESSYFDQRTATFHTKVVALCPIMSRADDFGDGVAKYPLFWVKYEDLAPFLAKQQLMTSNVNNAAVMSAEDYFTKNLYQGKIYKTNNMQGNTLAQYCPSDTAMAKEQKRIEAELAAFEKNIWGNQARKDSLDSIANAAKDVKGSVRKIRRSTGLRGASANTGKVSRVK
ncbi:MAG: gliding motility protein GldN, partial [Prevotella sp.]|nr:gliding motility protein GldN [Prevotella sp.]